MKTNKNNSGIKVRTSIRAAGAAITNHSRTGLKVRAGIKAGSTINVQNHNSLLFMIK